MPQQKTRDSTYGSTLLKTTCKYSTANLDAVVPEAGRGGELGPACMLPYHRGGHSSTHPVYQASIVQFPTHKNIVLY